MVSHLPQAIFIALAAIDFLTTRYAVRYAGPSAELNPIWRFGFERHRTVFDILYIAGTMALAALSLQLASRFILGLIASFTLTAINNCVAIMRIARRRRKD
jgi:hypothetical protein